MFKFSVLADLHLRSNEPYDGRIKKRLGEKLNVLQQFFTHAVDDHQDIVFLAGDIFDSREPPDWLRAEFLKVVMLATSNKLQVYILVGNHETNGVTSVYDAIDVIAEQHVPLLRIIKKPFKINAQGVNINMVPFCKPEEATAAVLDVNPDNKVNILIAHFDVDQALPSGGSAFKISTILRTHHFQDYDAAILGHIHQRQTHKIPTGRSGAIWTYVGSPLCQNFGERADQAPKSFYSVTCDGDELSIETIALADTTEFIQIDITEQTTAIETAIKEASKDRICKIVFSGSESFLRSTTIKSWQELARDLEKTGHAVKIITEIICTDREILAADDAEDPIPESANQDDQLKRLCTEKNRDDLLDEGRRYLEEANSEIASA